LRNISQAAENNKGPILEKLQAHFNEAGEVLEIGSGTGQHAIHFSSQMSHLSWQPTDCEAYFEPLLAGLREAGSASIKDPVYLKIGVSDWPPGKYEYVYSANVLHIMAEALMPAFFEGVGQCLKQGGCCCLYGPFRYQGAFTTESNAGFDTWLKGNDPDSGIRDIERVIALAAENGMSLEEDYAMPANNQLLVFRKN
jgi:cyclopropane fatty-acyl-phospholipid synthase-like methyltransferase